MLRLGLGLGSSARPLMSRVTQAVAAFWRLDASVLMPGAPDPVGLLNLLPYSDAANPVWSFFNVSGTATRDGRLLTFGASGIDRIIKSGGGLILTQGVQYTCAVKLSGSGVVRLFFVDGQGSTFLASTITLTSTPTYYVGTRVATATGGSGGLGVYGNGSPATLTVHETGIFAGDVTVAQIVANGGIPESQASAEAFAYRSPVPALPYRTYLDSAFMDMLEPVTQMDQPVGGVLDAARASPAVAQVLTNWDFAQGGEGWTVANTDATHIVTFANGAMRFQSDTTSPALTLSQSGRLTTFCMYRITGHVRAVNDNHGVHPTGRLKSDALGGVAFSRTTGPFEVFAVATSTNFNITRNTVNVDVTLDWIKCEQVLAKSVGPNLVANGSFDSDSGWAKGAGWSIADGKASKTAGAESNLSQAIPGLDQSKLYEIGIRHSVQAGVLYVRFGSLTTNYGTFLVDGEQTLILRPNGGDTIHIYGNASFVGWVDDITVREVTDATGTDYVTDRNSETRAITVPLDTLTGFSAKERSADVARSGGFSTKLTSITGSRLHYWNIRTVPAGVGITVSGWVYAPAAIGQALRAVDVADGSFIQQIAASADAGRWVYFQFTRPAKATQWTLALGQNSVGDWGTNAIYFDELSIADAVGEIAIQSASQSRPMLRRAGGKDHLEFDGVNDFLTYGRAVLSQASDNWVCASFELSAAPAAQGAIFSASNSGVAPPRVAYLFVNSDRRISCLWRDDANVAHLLNSTEAIVLNTRYVVSARRIGNVASLFVNGVQVSSSTVALGATTVNTSTVGALFATAVQSFFAGDIYHLSFGQSTLLDSDRVAIEMFAAGQAGMAL